MSKKTLLILLILVAALAAVWGVKGLLGRKIAGRTKALSIVVLKGIDPALVNEIEIAKGEESVVLTREGDTWKTGDAEADAEKINTALAAVKNASFTGPVARASANHDRLGVGADGLYVAVVQGDERRSFVIGNGGPTFDSSYVRQEGEDAVFLANVNLGFTFYPDVASWEKKEEEAVKQSE